jgi:hypothetical protein
MKNFIFWDIMPRSLVKADVSEVHITSILKVKARNWHETRSKHGLFLDPDDGNIFFLNIS